MEPILEKGDMEQDGGRRKMDLFCGSHRWNHEKVNYTGMDITCLYTSSCEFMCEGLIHSLCPRHVERNNYVGYHCSA